MVKSAGICQTCACGKRTRKKSPGGTRWDAHQKKTWNGKGACEQRHVRRVERVSEVQKSQRTQSTQRTHPLVQQLYFVLETKYNLLRHAVTLVAHGVANQDHVIAACIKHDCCAFVYIHTYVGLSGGNAFTNWIRRSIGAAGPMIRQPTRGSKLLDDIDASSAHAGARTCCPACAVGAWHQQTCVSSVAVNDCAF